MEDYSGRVPQTTGRNPRVGQRSNTMAATHSYEMQLTLRMALPSDPRLRILRTEPYKAVLPGLVQDVSQAGHLGG